MVRISLGFYNDHADVDRLLDALRQIATGGFAGRYRSDRHGEFHPVGAVEESSDHYTTGAR
jgi:hypothetical protein